MSKEFCRGWTELSNRAYENGKVHGFDATQHPGISLALIHEEVSEVLRAYRINNPESTKIPTFTQVEEELADIVIRVMDHARAHRYSVAAAILAKMDYNESRPYKHGGKAF